MYNDDSYDEGYYAYYDGEACPYALDTEDCSSWWAGWYAAERRDNERR